MSGFEIIGALVILWIVGYSVKWVYDVIMETVEDAKHAVRRREERKRKQQTVTAPVYKKKTEEEILSDPYFIYSLEGVRPVLRCFTLAGDIRQPEIIFNRAEKQIVLEKQGYDLSTYGLNLYYNDKDLWERGLEIFAEDLFGYRAEEVKAFFSMTYIADHLIKVEEPSKATSDYTLTWSGTVVLEDPKEFELFERELRQTPLFENQTS